MTGKYAAYDKVVLKTGSTGSAVKVLQAALKVTPVDGDFGPLTKAKVVAYQKSKKLSATGIVTSPVWRALSADADRPTGKYAAYDKVVLQTGSTGSAVKVLQSALKVTPVDGDFGPLTKAKVVAYQKSRKLSATGIVTSPVWRALSLDAARSSAAASRSMARTAPAGSPSLGRTVSLTAAAKVTGRFAAYDALVLQVGSTGSAVKVLQAALGVTADGDFGPLTKAAVVGYQKQKKLPADGVVRSALWRALSADAASPGAKPATVLHAERQRLRPRRGDEPVRRLRPGAGGSHGHPDRADVLPGHHPDRHLGRGPAAGQPPRPHPRRHAPCRRHRRRHRHRLRPGDRREHARDLHRQGHRRGAPQQPRRAGRGARQARWSRPRPPAPPGCASRGPAPAPWPAGPPRCRSPVSGRYRSHAGQAYRCGEMAISRTGSALNLVNVLRLGDEYLLGVPEAPFYWGPHGSAALQAQALAARTFAYTEYRAGVSASCDCHVYDGTMSQTYDGYRIEQDPNARYWSSALSATKNSVITYQGQPINATYYSALGRARRWTCVTCGAAPCRTCAA